jgi:membrane protease YdiL (CAAX protease family)
MGLKLEDMKLFGVAGGSGSAVVQDFFIVFVSVVIITLTPINTKISLDHIAVMASMLSTAVLIPYLYYRSKAGRQIRFNYRFQSILHKEKIGFILFMALVSYFVFPFYFQSTGAYANWPSVHTAKDVVLLFIGTNALGLWDELFFVNTMLTIFRRHAKFWIANLAQAVFFTAFLYELGFRGWAPFVIYPFALLQGYMFMRFKSLGFVIATHLSIDFILFLAILNAYGKLPFSFFVTG